ncbi:hypothetical protein [Phytoactinopolyspora halophila]|nr:hypothetical protein [Phytoactinopolyspora halophila]
MIASYPANPMSIELTFGHRRFWWQDNDNPPPHHVDVSADVWEYIECPPELRHVGDLTLAIADLEYPSSELDSVSVGEHAMMFLTQRGVSPDGTLHPDLDDLISPGPPRAIVLRWVELSSYWRGRGVGPGLVAAALTTFKKSARLGLCHLTAADIEEYYPDRSDAEEMVEHLATLLKSLGFIPWGDAYVIDLRNDSLTQARRRTIERFERYFSDFN